MKDSLVSFIFLIELRLEIFKGKFGTNQSFEQNNFLIKKLKAEKKVESDADWIKWRIFDYSSYLFWQFFKSICFYT